MSFKVGDTVSLKSGGPDMTITRIGTAGGEPMIWCVWFEGTKGLKCLWWKEAVYVHRRSWLRHENHRRRYLSQRRLRHPQSLN